MRTTAVVVAWTGFVLAAPAMAGTFAAAPGEMQRIRSGYMTCVDAQAREFAKREAEVGMDVAGETVRACASYVEIARRRDPAFASKIEEEGESRAAGFMFARARGR